MWTENKIAAALARQVFNRKNLVVVPNCTWTGCECDLLVLTPTLRIIDVEVKISRADLKADAKKYKWWQRKFVGYGALEETRDASGRLLRSNQAPIYDSVRLSHPPRVWKHYYAMPADIWQPELVEFLPSLASGVILLRKNDGGVQASIERSAKPNKDAEKLNAEAAIDIARLASLRMWNSFDKDE